MPLKDPVVVADRPALDLDPDVGSVDPDDTEFVPVLGQLAEDHEPCQHQVLCAVSGVDEAEDGPPDRVGHRVTGELLPGMVEEGPAPIWVDREDDLADAFHDRPVARLAVAEVVARGLRDGHGPFQARAVAVQDEADEADDRGEGPHPHRRLEFGRQVRGGRGELDEDGGGDRGDPCGDHGGLEEPTAQDREGEGDRQDRTGREGRDGRRDRRHEQADRERGDDQECHAALSASGDQQSTGVDQGQDDGDLDHRRSPRCGVVGLHHEHDAEQGEERDDHRHRAGEVDHVAGLVRGQRTLRWGIVGCSARGASTAVSVDGQGSALRSRTISAPYGLRNQRR